MDIWTETATGKRELPNVYNNFITLTRIVYGLYTNQTPSMTCPQAIIFAF